MSLLDTDSELKVIVISAFISVLLALIIVLSLVLLVSGSNDPAELKVYTYPVADAQRLEQYVFQERDGKPFTCEELFDLLGEPFTVDQFEESSQGQFVACVE